MFASKRQKSHYNAGLLLQTVLHADHVAEEAVLLPEVADLDLERGGLSLERLDRALGRFQLEFLLGAEAGGCRSALFEAAAWVCKCS